MPNSPSSTDIETVRTTRPSADATRASIIDAAIELFSERSFEGATTRQIAGRAGVTQPLLNYHFRTKQDLWQASVDALFERLNAAIDARSRGLRGVDPVQSGKLLVREFITFSARYPQLHRMIMQESKTDSPRMAYLVENHVRPIYEATTALFDQLVKHGQVPDIDPAHLYYILTGAGPTMFVLAPESIRLTGLDVTSDEVIEAHADAVCRLLFGADDAN